MSRNFENRLDCAITIMKRLLDSNPGLVPPRIENIAWAQTYTYGGDGFTKAGQRKQALTWYLKAIRTRPHYVPAWKQLVLWSIEPIRGTHIPAPGR